MLRTMQLPRASQGLDGVLNQAIHCEAVNLRGLTLYMTEDGMPSVLRWAPNGQTNLSIKTHPQ